MIFVQAFRFAGLTGVGAIIALSLTSGTLRPQTGFSGYIEHFSAYAIVAALLALGWTSQSQRNAIIVGSFALAAALEALQLWVPGRTGDALSAIVSGAAGMFGVLIVAECQRRLRRVA